MAAFDTTSTQFGSVGTFGRLGQALRTTFAELASWNDQRMTRRVLNKLTDRELNDIGLCRGDIEAIARRS